MRSGSRLVMVFGLVCAARAAAQDGITVVPEDVLARFGEEVTLPQRIVLGAAQAVTAPGGDQIFLIHFIVEAPADPTKWKVKVTADGQPLWSSEDADETETDFWSAPIRRVKPVVAIEASGVAPRVTIDRLAVQKGVTRPEAIVGDPELEPIANQSPRVQGWGRSVARLWFVGADKLLHYCTAFLVSPEWMMTNQHCISSDTVRKSASAHFDYDGGVGLGTEVRLKELGPSDWKLDYALVRIEKRHDGRAPFKLVQADLKEKRPLIVIQHPGGEPKQVSLVGCRVDEPSVVGRVVIGQPATKTDFSHGCDTLGGSSGSAVQDTTSGDVVGLHHLGFPLNPAPGSKPLNRGVQIGLILADVQAKNPVLAAELHP